MDNCTYSPQLSQLNPNITPMPDAPPVSLVNINHITLEYPWDTPTSTIEIRNPQFNDHLTINKSIVFRYSRGNDILMFRDSIWPLKITLNMNFEGLSQTIAQDLQDFIALSLGKYILLTTYESLSYKGIITNPQNPISQENPGCGYTAKIDFQGVLQI